MIEQTQERTIEEVQQIAHDYASYSQSKNGLGTVYGGVIGIAVYLINTLLGRVSLTPILTISLTVCWFVGKEVIRQRMYRCLGKAQEIWPACVRRRHLITVIVVTVFMFGMWLFFLNAVFFRPWGWLTGLFALFHIIVSPWLMWRYLRTPNEFSVGVFLLIACMVSGLGTALQQETLAGLLITLLIPLAALRMIYTGFKEHFAFRALVAASLGEETDHEYD